MRFTPVAPSFLKSGLPPANTLLRYDFIDVSLATQILDLTQDPSSLLRDMRKGHRYDVKRGEQLLQGRVLDKHTITPEVFTEYRRLHQKAAGRMTRPAETFEMMYEWICAGLAVLARASRDGTAVGFALISVYKDGAYYSSGCEDPALDLPAGHVLQWQAMQWLMAHGIRYYEIGWQQYGNLPHDVPSPKELDIAHFKRGFGGTAVPLFVGEKFYSKDHYVQVTTERMGRFARTIGRPGTSGGRNGERA
jgi:hypothetical protein